ncbi:MAG: DegT/DnrJ/EryC1/StrS family aminotransferase [Candidatus Omnitrophota bacterium]
MKKTFTPKQYEMPWPYTGALFGWEEEAALVRMIRATSEKRRPLDRRSPEIAAFEERFAAYIGVEHAISVSSGGTALELAARLLKIGAGDEVLITALTFKATVLPVVLAGARPVPVDIEYDSLNVNLERLEAQITPRTKAIFVIDYAGLPLDPEAVMAIGRKHGLPVVEDAAHALGAAYLGVKCGAWADITCFSFQSQKNISTLGEGGMITTPHKEYAERARELRNYDHEREAGSNYRLSAAQCAVGIEQLKRLEFVNKKRRRIGRRMSAALRDIAGFVTPCEPEDATHAYHMYPCRLDEVVFGAARDVVRKKLLDDYAVETSFQYAPWYTFPVIQKAMGDFEPCPVMDRVARELFGLPIYPGYADDEVDYLIWAVHETLASL